MKRKVIQIADSTQLVSLPRNWAIAHNIKKGDEINVDEQENALIISTSHEERLESAKLNIHDLEPLTGRIIRALYKRGLDEIRVDVNKHEELEIIQKSLGPTIAVGFEIVEQGQNYCLIKNISANIDEFDPLIKRTFLMLNTMAEEGLKAIKEKNYAYLKNLLPLEESNNRFTIICRRYLNKRGHKEYKVGPLYLIVESLENTADEFKYLFQYLSNAPPKTKVQDEVLEMYQDVINSLRAFFRVFYKYNKDDVVFIGNTRKKVVDKFYKLIKETKRADELIMLHHLIIIEQKIFSMIGPLIAAKNIFGSQQLRTSL